MLCFDRSVIHCRIMFSGFPRTMPAFFAELSVSARAERGIGAAELTACRTVFENPANHFIEQFRPVFEALRPSHHGASGAGGSILAPFRRAGGGNTPEYTAPYGHVVFWTGTYPLVSPTLHMVFSAGGLGVGAGTQQFDETQGKAYRSALRDGRKADALLGALEKAEAAGCFIESRSRLFTHSYAGDGLDPGKLADLEGLTVRSRGEEYPDVIFDDRCGSWLVDRLAPLLPLQAWLVAAFAD